ncbi:DUF488 family protein [Streptomyces sp. NPDC005805]|uniref:DUF488 domain-containing protein n=1 Tax=Streptomyces sp. NPDC005805 TaxID=3157068 RepID=UPI0033F41DE4
MTRQPGTVRIRRVYEDPSDDDGVRLLVDRLWPRGLAKTRARLDEWPKALTPSTELRRWYHGPDGEFGEFRRRYEQELAEPPAADALRKLRAVVADRPVTLLTASRDVDTSHAEVLREILTDPDPDAPAG